jgi:hypothetical protein
LVFAERINAASASSNSINAIEQFAEVRPVCRVLTPMREKNIAVAID